MATKSIEKGVMLTIAFISLSLSLPRTADALSQETENSKLGIPRDAVQEVDPLKCPISQKCHDESQIDTDPLTKASGKKASFLSKGIGDDREGDNSGISNDLMNRVMNDAPLTLNIQEPEASKQPSKSKGRSKANKKLKRKNRRKKCRKRRRKLKLERQIQKRGGKVKNGGNGMSKRQGKKGMKKKKRMKKCGIGKGKRKMKKKKKKKKDRKRRKNGKKRKNGKVNSDSGIDTSNSTMKSILDSNTGVQETQEENTVDVSVLGSGVKDIETKSKQLDTDTSPIHHNSEETTRHTTATDTTGKTGIDSNRAGVGDGGTSSASEPEFDAVQITAMFENAVLRGPDGLVFVDLGTYVNAYKRLASVFHFFGPIFSFAKSELEEKIDILGQLHSSNIQGQAGENYDTFKTMFEYEYKNGIAQPGGRGTSGVRENAWIHRALKFIIAIVRTIADKTDTSPLHTRVKQFYTDILAPHHSWIVRMGVYAAIYSFPSRETLLNDMKITDDADGLREVTRLAESLQTVYDLIQARYEKYASPK